MDKMLLRIIGFLITISLFFTGCGKQSGEPAVTTDAALPDDSAQNVTQAGGPELADGLFVAEVFSYSGPYVEDGGNEACEGICAVRLFNASPVHYRYLRFAVQTGGGEYTFVATTLFSGAKMTVLCEDKLPFTDGEIISSRILNEVPFEQAPSVHTESLLITYTDGFINVKNLTEAPLADVYVYYKNTDDYGYLGGITYRTSFGEITAGEISQKGAANIHADSGIVVFVTYAE